MKERKKIFEALDAHFDLWNRDAELRLEALAIVRKLKANGEKLERSQEKLEDLAEAYILAREEEDDEFDGGTLASIEQAISDLDFDFPGEFDPEDPARRPKTPVEIEKAKARIWRFVLRGGA
jgi:hypothetical protein